jgi:hypothetical protein
VRIREVKSDQENRAPEGPPKNFGDALLHPRAFQTFEKKLTSSSWLSSSLPFYSPLQTLKFAPAMLAQRVLNHHV